MLVELNVVEQRYRVVLEVLEGGLPITEVAPVAKGQQPLIIAYKVGGKGRLQDMVGV